MKAAAKLFNFLVLILFVEIGFAKKQDFQKIPASLDCKLEGIYEKPSLDSKKLPPIQYKCDCKDAEVPLDAPKDIELYKLYCQPHTLYYDEQQKVAGTKRGLVQVLKNVVIPVEQNKKMTLNAGDKFEYVTGEEGECTIFIKGAPESYPCYWGGGYGYFDGLWEARRSFIHLRPDGPQTWYHLVTKDQKAFGWYVEGLVTDPPQINFTATGKAKLLEDAEAAKYAAEEEKRKHVRPLALSTDLNIACLTQDYFAFVSSDISNTMISVVTWDLKKQKFLPPMKTTFKGYNGTVPSIGCSKNRIDFYYINSDTDLYVVQPFTLGASILPLKAEQTKINFRSGNPPGTQAGIDGHGSDSGTFNVFATIGKTRLEILYKVERNGHWKPSKENFRTDVNFRTPGFFEQEA